MASQSKGSIAPKERVNITYTPATGDEESQVELPLKMLVLGDFVGRQDDRPVEDRKPINIDKDNFSAVLREQEISLELSVDDKLSGEEGQDLAVKLRVENLRDLSPEGIVEQVPELKKLMDLRNALTSLKGPLGNIPAFRKKLAHLLQTEEGRAQLVAELGLGDSETSAPHSGVEVRDAGEGEEKEEGEEGGAHE